MRLLALLLLVLSFFPSDTHARKVDPYDAVVALRNQLGQVFCSGVVYQGQILTAHHCSDNGDSYVEHNGKKWLLRVVREDESQDLALMASVLGHYFGKGVRLARRDPEVGARVWVVGYPLSRFGKHMTQGVVSNAYGKYVGQETLWHDGAQLRGNSGGGVFNRRGRLVGIVSFGIMQGLVCPFGICPQVPMFQDSTLAGATHIKAIRRFLNHSS